MFRCKECGCEFKIKPEYCDCGNNTFDEIQTAPLHAMPDFRQILSVIIFVLCLILAIIPWTIKDKTPQKKPEVKKAEPVTQEIPDIEKIWNSTPVKIQTPEPTPEPVAVKVIVHPEPQKTEPVVKKQPQTKPVQKPVEKKVQKPVQTKQTPTPAPKKETPKPAQQTQTPAPVPPVQKNEETKRQTFTPPVIKQKPVDKTPLINYKNELRIALLSKLNVPNIQGSGDCAISFAIDSSGKLINRGFIYKSSNKTVNDEVYYMLMRLPNFKKPPEIYGGETIKMKFYINNGYYEISFIQ